MGRKSEDRDRIVALHLVEEDIDGSNNEFVCNRFNGAGRKQFNLIIAFRDNIVSR